MLLAAACPAATTANLPVAIIRKAAAEGYFNCALGRGARMAGSDVLYGMNAGGIRVIIIVIQLCFLIIRRPAITLLLHGRQASCNHTINS